jgi:ATP-dependent protease HslVU (ClpYQ) peptidase subunit
MSLIVGLETKNRIYMACDSQATGDTDKRYLPHSKIFKTNNGYIVGFAGSLRSAQLIMRHDFPDDIWNVPDTLREHLKNFGGLSHGKDEDMYGEIEVMQSSLLIGFKGSLYEIQGDFGILTRVEPYAAIGEGRPYALGVMYATENKKMQPRKRLELAVQCGINFNNTVGGRIYIESMAQ